MQIIDTNNDLSFINENLKNANVVLRTLIDTLPIPFFYKGIDGRYIICNKAYAELCGMTFENMVGKTVDELFPVGLSDLFNEKDKELISNNGTLQSYTSEIVLANGTKKHFVITKSIVKDNCDKLLGIVGLVNDITALKETEFMLLEKERNLREILDATTEGICIYSILTKELFLSPSFYEALGYSKDEFNPTIETLKTFIHPDDLLKLEELKEAMFVKNQKMFETIYRFRAKDGSYRWIKNRVKAVDWDEKGNVLRLIGCHTDISIEKEKTLALEFQEKTYRSLFENSPIGMYCTTPDGKILRVNKALVNLLGFDSEDEVRKLNLEDASSSRFGRGQIREEFKKLIEKNGVIKNYRTAWKNKNDEILEIRESASTVRDDAGNILFYQGIVEDVTAQEKALDELKRSEERLKLTFENSTDAILWLDDEKGIFINCNLAAENFFEKKKEEIIGSNIFSLFGKDNESQYIEKFKETSNIPPQIEDEVEFLTPSGKKKYAITTRVKFSNALNVLWQIVFHDITDAKTYQAELEKAKSLAENANKAKSDFLANLSHEIRTPVASIVGFIDLLIEPETTDTEKKQYLDIILRNAQYLQALVSDTLDISKIEAGQHIVKKEKFDFLRELSNISLLLRSKAEKENVELHFIVESLLPEHIYSDSLQFKQVVMNLVGNAIKYSPNGKVNVRIRTKKSDDFDPEAKLYIVVEDNGIGLSETDKKNIFKPFFQASTPLHRKRSGTGLGLSLAKHFARALGGDVRLISSQIGKGSTFEISFSIGDEEHLNFITVEEKDLLKSYVKSTSDKVCNYLSGLRILIAEDTEELRFLYKNLLLRHGASVTATENGLVACEKAFSESFDVIIMDMQMPVMDGYEATARIREKLPDIPIIALTARTTKSEMEKCFQVGCSDYISKTREPKKIIELVRKY